jgi:hypothetical protein
MATMHAYMGPNPSRERGDKKKTKSKTTYFGGT